MTNITLLGTSHISNQSVRQIKQEIETNTPDIVAIELDNQRLYALLHHLQSRIKLSDIQHIGVKGFIFALIGSYVQKKLAKYINTKPGQDMLAAFRLAKKHNSKIALIDQPIHITLRRFSQTLSWREKWHALVDIVRGTLFPKRELKRLGLSSLNLRKVPEKEVISRLLALMKERYPNIYNVLLIERNKYMVKKLQKIQKEYPESTVLAVVGAAHVEGMEKLLKQVPKNKHQPKESITYSFEATIG